MTSKSDFTEQEWELLREGPPTAGVIVATSSKGGTFRESWALAKAFSEARKRHGQSELLDALVAETPHAKRYHSPRELEDQGLQRLGEAVRVLEQKASPQEVDAYRRFTLDVAEHVSEAHEEGGAPVSAEEREALDKIEATMKAGERT